MKKSYIPQDLGTQELKVKALDINTMTRALSLSFLMAFTMSNTALAGEGHDHNHGATKESPLFMKHNDSGDEHEHDIIAGMKTENEPVLDEHDEEAIVLSEQQRTLAGIEVVKLSSEAFNLDAVATATLAVDRDRTVSLAPQVDVRIQARHVVPGQKVEQGQPLLTLSGSAVAQAQANFINAAAEWNRVRRMGANVISASSRQQAEVDAELKRAVLEAMKMTTEQIKALESNPKAIGSYQLLAPISGRVQQDIAMLGQVVEAGTNLLQLTDESHLWVEAQLTPAQADNISVGSLAMVRVESKILEGIIIGRSHELDRQTRTESVLVSMENPGHQLHAGQFAELYLPMDILGTDCVIMPDAALTRGGDGDWQVFIEDKDGFEAIEVEVLERQRGMNLVKGLEADANVVVSGAFFLASELAKSGFDIHAH